ncbi:MAG TPA: hypothetical protein VLI39_12775 [Sedimentisphaerales bacterium]|nr:hypothetical protein [Sedimentisphaerales bacterium]
MELYNTHPDQHRRGIMPWAELVLVVAAVVAIVGAAIWWLVCPGAGALWRTWVAPIIENVRHTIGA